MTIRKIKIRNINIRNIGIFVLVLCLFTLPLSSVKAQNKVSVFTFGGGYTIQNNWTANAAWEISSKTGYNRFGVQAEILWYKEKSWTSPMRLYSGGLFYKNQFYDGKNFAADWFIGGAAATNNTQFFCYPFGGFEQIFYLTPTLQLFIAERASYIFNTSSSGWQLGNNWQPSIHAGIKISL